MVLRVFGLIWGGDEREDEVGDSTRAVTDITINAVSLASGFVESVGIGGTYEEM